jgi:hypothetical protein
MNREQEKIYEDGFIAGMQKQMQSSVDKAVNRMAQRAWVGLTEEDFSAINQSCLTKLEAAASAESILKEKNT